MNFDQILLNILLSLPGFMLAIVFHEAAHAYMAFRFGDNTAKLQGRLSLNPAVHYDPMGTILFPLIGAIFGGYMFGWARPVPVDTRNFKNIKSGVFWVSFAGPLANIFIAVLSIFLMTASFIHLPDTFQYKDVLGMIFKNSAYINMIIAVFNLLPFPPLDGSKMLSTFLNYEQNRKLSELGNYTFFIFIVMMFTGTFRYLFIPAQIFMQVLAGLFTAILA